MVALVPVAPVRWIAPAKLVFGGKEAVAVFVVICAAMTAIVRRDFLAARLVDSTAPLPWPVLKKLALRIMANPAQ